MQPDQPGQQAADAAALYRIVCAAIGRQYQCHPRQALEMLGRSYPGGDRDAQLVMARAGVAELPVPEPVTVLPRPVPLVPGDARPAAQNRTSNTREMYESDPAHDPRVMAALRDGLPGDAVAALMAEIAAERDMAGRPPTSREIWEREERRYHATAHNNRSRTKAGSTT